MKYIVKCSCCGNQSIIEKSSPEAICRAACPVCQAERTLLLLNDVDEMLPSPEEIAEALSLDNETAN